MTTRTMGTEKEPPMIDVSPFHRYPLVIINLVIMVISGTMIGVSIYSLYVRWDDIHYVSFTVTVMVNLEIPFSIIGSFAFTMSTMGFIGSLRENIRVLDFYIYAICFLMILTALAATLAFAIPLLSKKSIQAAVPEDLVVHYRDNADFQRLVDYVQFTFECCGFSADGYHSWNHNVYFNCTRENPSTERCCVPPSCCRLLEGEEELDDVMGRRFCGQNVLSETEQAAWKQIHTRSCVETLIGTVKTYSLYFTIGSCVVLVILLALRSMATRVRSEIISLTDFYEKYYAKIRQGERMTLIRSQALRDVPRGCVVVKPRRAPSLAVPAPPVQYRGPVLVRGSIKPAIPQ